MNKEYESPTFEKKRKKYYSAEELNRHIERIIEEGYTPPTRLQRYQEGRKSIVVSNELMGAGFIRTYDEMVKFMQRRHEKPFEKSKYESMLISLQEDLGIQRTYQGFIREERKRLSAIVTDMDNMLGTTTNIKKYNTKFLYDAVKEANLRVKESNAKSPLFYEFLHEILSSGKI